MNNLPPSSNDREMDDRSQHVRRLIDDGPPIDRNFVDIDRDRISDISAREHERMHRESQYQPVPQHQNNTGTIPIHQPVASRLPGAIHSPGGLLANHGSGPPPSGGPLGAPQGPGNAFGGPLHSGGENRGIQQQHQMFGPAVMNHPSNTAIATAAAAAAAGPAQVFGGPLQQQQQQQQQQQEQAARAAAIQQIPFAGPNGNAHQGPGAQALAQGQQPILNDALSYLDQVKVQFSDQPDVYNKFLDIMKDFKSQAIDTPGVINRVSELFAGHPNLIQGFNTFLPPGYRIECGAGNDPNTIRVTTPMGTTVQSITGPGRAALPDSGIGAAGPYHGQRGNSWQQQPQHSIESPEAVFSPQSRNTAYGQTQSMNSYEAAQAAAAHQQEQRGVSHLQNAAIAATGQGIPRNAVTPTPGGQGAGNSVGPQQHGVEKRGPVEFNHAISYVNKIKNRFQDKPEIYKQFLEILQTYQRESKPIQDVYAQVTTLFSTAPDLLDDFKQFLPESAAQAKQAAAAKAAEDIAVMGLAGVSQTPQARGGVDQKNMPPVGNFAPPSTSKENKKRPRPSGASTNPAIMGPLGDGSASRNSTGQPGLNKRAKTSHVRSGLEDGPDVAPTLTPLRPQPMEPAASSLHDADVTFFEKVKKYLSNKQTYAEFLKLCNLYSLDLIDKNMLVHKVSKFIGGNVELIEFFKTLVGYTGPEEVILNEPKAPTGRVSLSNCRGLGPSYRLLPARERAKPCAGRDELGNSTLNDEWASHPTWASEDSGFIAHRKNVFEEALHRIEEERHDYDFNIDANYRVIQLLEPVAAQILLLKTPSERENFKMPGGVAASCQSIYKRVFKKIWGVDKGPEIVQALFVDPISVLPTVLSRLMQKNDEWKFAQREWQKVWRAQTQAIYMKSLDHQGIHAKTTDKKTFSPKHIVDLIKLKHEELRVLRGLKQNVPRYQFSYDFSDKAVILDALHHLMFYVSNANQFSASERRKTADFLESFVPSLFGIKATGVRARLQDLRRDSDDDEEEDTPTELSNGRGRRTNGQKNGDLLRNVLDPGQNGTKGRGSKGGSGTGSKESTPDMGSAGEDDDINGGDDSSNVAEVSDKWLSNAIAPATMDGTQGLGAGEHLELKADQPFKRDYYSLYCNQTILVFFTLFETLYRRLKDLKESEADVAAEVRRRKGTYVAKALGMMAGTKDWFVEEQDEECSLPYYQRTLALIEEYMTNEFDEVNYQDFLRSNYLMKGWQMYTILELMKALSRAALGCASNDSKEKTNDIIKSFEVNRASVETTFNVEIEQRKKVEKIVRDGDMFLIKYVPSQKKATAQFILKDDTTFELTDMERKERWKYYTSSYVRIEPTEGVPRDRIKKSVLTRNIRPSETDSDVEGSSLSSRKPLFWSEELILRICVNSYVLTFKPHSTEMFIYAQGIKDDENLDAVKERRSQKFREHFVMNSKWMKGLSQGQVERVNEDFEKWTKDGVIPPSPPAPATSTALALTDE